MDEIAEITSRLEYMFLKTIVTNLRANTMDVAQAKQLAQEFLNIEPFTTVDDAKQKIGEFVASHAAFGKLKEFVDAFHHEQQVDEVVAKMRQHIQENNLDEALKVAKG